MAVYEFMDKWIRVLLNEPRCMDCKVVLEEGEGTMEFRGQLLYIEYIGHLCKACWERREEIRRYRRSLSPREEKRPMLTTSSPMPSAMPSPSTMPFHPHRALLSQRASTDMV